jgi:uncharacterized membrane protein YbaN (DUF454 family)
MLMLIFIHSSFSVLNFLPACTPQFATVAHKTQKVKQTALSIMLIYCTVMCKYCEGTQESVRTLRNMILKLCLSFPSVVLQQCTAKGNTTTTTTSTLITMYRSSSHFLKWLISQKWFYQLNKASPRSGSFTLLQNSFVIKYKNPIFYFRNNSGHSHDCIITSAPHCSTHIFQVHFL